MSAIARWSYRNTAQVKPFISEDSYTGVITYGAEYSIDCTWAAESKQMRDATGAEFVSNYIIWSEDARPKHRDLILLNTQSVTDWQEIRSHMEWDMNMFDEAPDYRTVTGDVRAR